MAQAMAVIWPWMAYVFHIRSTADFFFFFFFFTTLQPRIE